MTSEARAAESRVLVVTPTKRDAQVTCQLLETANIECVVCDDLRHLALEVASGAGAILLTDAALGQPAMAELQSVLANQAAWSDVATILLTRDRDRSPAASRSLAALTNVTLLDRPCSTRSVVSAVETALRARRKQYQIRDHLLRQDEDQAALREADVRKDEFLATLAHELRNPLAAVCTGVQVLSRSPGEPERASRMVGMIDRQSRLLVKLIDDLLDVSRIATGKVVLSKERIDLRSVVEAALETSQTVLESSRHALAIDYSAGPLWVDGDASRLAQVVGNLVNNAAKYTPDGGRIDVAMASENGEAVIRVTDNGVGIPADMLPLVFDMFTQVDRTLERSQGGLGIGLSLVRRLMTLHNGTASAFSEGRDRGSVFTVALPLADAPRPHDELAGGPAEGAARRLRIVVVDDNADVADSLSVLLVGEGHELRTAYSGAAGLAVAEAFLPDVVFCDIGMAGVDGHEVAARLRADERFASTLLVAVTGWGTEEHRSRTRLAGFDVHLTKPVDLEDVARILADV